MRFSRRGGRVGVGGWGRVISSIEWSGCRQRAARRRRRRPRDPRCALAACVALYCKGCCINAVGMRSRTRFDFLFAAACARAEVIYIYSTAAKSKISATETETEAEAGTETRSRQGMVGIGRSERVMLYKGLTRATAPRAPSQLLAPSMQHAFTTGTQLVGPSMPSTRDRAPMLRWHLCIFIMNSVRLRKGQRSRDGGAGGIERAGESYQRTGPGGIDRDGESYQRTPSEESNPLLSSQATQHLTPECPCSLYNGVGPCSSIRRHYKLVTSLTRVLPAARPLFAIL